MTSSAARVVVTPEQYAARHKQAFRLAFDFLNAHFPPAHNDEWWIQLCNDCSKLSAEHEDNPMLAELLCGILAYLETESKLRKEGEE